MTDGLMAVAETRKPGVEALVHKSGFRSRLGLI
jgi:hypothetical protein